MTASQVCSLLKSVTFLRSLIVGLLSGGLTIGLRYFDVDQGYNFLAKANPDAVVFNVFVVFASLVAAFRTSHALVRYVDAAALMNKMSSCWYDAFSTSITFTRTSQSDEDELSDFQETLLRLFSLVNAMCLDGLQPNEPGHSFEVIGYEDLSEDFQASFLEARCKVEFVFQSIHQLMMDAMTSKIVTTAPPLLARPFADLGESLTTYHEAKKFSSVPLPYAYRLITRMILITEAVFVPFMLATTTRGYFSAFIFTFGGTTLLWLINGVSENLDNPFKKEASTLEADVVQHYFNCSLQQVISNAKAKTPAMSGKWRTNGRPKEGRGRICVEVLRARSGRTSEFSHSEEMERGAKPSWSTADTAADDPEVPATPPAAAFWRPRKPFGGRATVHDDFAV